MTNYSQGTVSGDFNIGALISESIAVLNRALPRFLVLAVIPVIPTLLLVLGMGATTSGMASSGVIATLVFTLLSMVLLFAIQGGMIYGAFNELRGQPFTVGDALSKGFARLLPLLGVSFLSGLVIMIGSMLLILPGLWLFCVLYAAAAVCVVEQRGVTDSMSRSGELTKGYRWHILGLILIVGIASEFISWIVQYVGAHLGGITFGVLLGELVHTYMIALGSVVAVLAYYRLRLIKDGVDIDRLANVFD